MKRTIIVVAIGISICLLTLPVIYGILQYRQANGRTCQSSAEQSSGCLTKFTAKVLEVDTRTTRTCYSYAGCTDDRTPLTGIVFSANGKRHTLWLKEAPSNAKPGNSIELLAWNGQYIGVIEQGHQRTSYYWEPTFLLYALSLATLSSLLGVALLWVERIRRMPAYYEWVIRIALGLSLFIIVMASIDGTMWQFLL